MKKRSRILALIAVLVMSLVVSSVASAAPLELSTLESPEPSGHIVVANRGSGSISVIDVATDQAMTVPLPADPNAPEPMYVVYSPSSKRVFVGDRANDRVVAFNARDWSVDGMVPTGAGVFHMWADPQDNQLWVNNDVDNTATVFNPRTLEVLATVVMPADLTAMGGKPHDVVLDTNHAYVSLVGLAGTTGSDYVVKFDKRTFQEVARAAVGGDPHLSLTLTNHNLYVPTQGGGAVAVLDRRTLAQVAEIAVPGAHGAGMVHNGRTFYTTNLTGGGIDALWTIDTRHNALVGTAVDTPYAVPHNIAVTAKNDKLYVTHSGGASDKVSVFAITRQDPVPAFLGEVTVGLNPFGLAYVP